MKRILLLLLLSGMMFSCSKKNKDCFTQLSDLDGYRGAAVVGTTHDSYIKSHFTKSKALLLNDYPDLPLALRSNQCDFLLVDFMVANDLVKNYSDIVVFDTVYDEDFGVAFQQSDIETRESFNKFLAEIKSNGIYNEMYKRWDCDFNDMKPLDIEHVTDGKEFIVGVPGNIYPFSMIKDGKMVGLDIEMMERFALETGRVIKIMQLPFGSLIAALSTGQIDVVAASMTITEERKKQVAFSDPYYKSHSVVVCMKDRVCKSGNIYTCIDDLKGHNVGVLLGSSQDSYVTKNYNDVNVLRFDLQPDLILSLLEKQCDAIVYEYMSAQNVMQKNPKIGVLTKSLWTTNYYIGFQKGDDELPAQFSSFLKEIKENGVYDDVYNRWINNTETSVMPVIENSGRNGKLRCSTTGQSPVFSFIKDEELAGFDIEMLLRFGAYLEKEVVFSTATFDGILTALITKKTDVIANTLMFTEERAAKITYSEPYFESATALLALKDNLQVNDDVVVKESFFKRIKNSFYNNLILEKRYKLIFSGLWETVIISIFSILTGVLLGSLICYLRMRKSRFASGFAKAYINLIRGIPILVLLMIMFYVVFASVGISATIVAIITFAINFSAYVSEMFRTSIQGVDKGQTEAGVALGFTKTQTFIYIVLPQAVKTVLPVFKGESISLIKMTSIVGYIAIQDLTKASDIIRSRTFDAFFPLIVISIIYFILAWLMGLLLDRIGKKHNK